MGLEDAGGFEVQVAVGEGDGEGWGGGVEGVDAVGAEGADEEVALLEVGAEGAVAEGGVEVVNGGIDTLVEFLFAEGGEEDEVSVTPASSSARNR